MQCWLDFLSTQSGLCSGASQRMSRLFALMKWLFSDRKLKLL